MKRDSIIELLEFRIAPAVLVNARTVTFTDVDGDLVTVKTSKPVLDAGAFTFNTAFGDPGPQQMQLLDLQNSGPASGTSVTITAKRGPSGGDGFVNVGFVDASGTDLGAVSVRGDLGRIEAGDPNNITSGLKILSVQSMGEHGTTTQAAGGNLASIIRGALGTLLIKGNLRGAAIDIIAPGALELARLGKAVITGSMIGSAEADGGSIETFGAIGSITVGGDLIGGTANLAGRIHAIGGIGKVVIGGSVFGGGAAATVETGVIDSDGDLGSVKIGGDIVGKNTNSARILAGGKLGALTVGGTIFGSANGGNSGDVFAGGDIGAVKIGGDLRGDSALTGRIESGGKITSITLGGSLVGGRLGSSGEIRAATGLGAVKIGRDFLGGTGSNMNGFISTAGGGLKSLTIGGSMIGGTDGTNAGSVQINGDIGAIKIGGDFIGGAGAGQAAGSITAVGGDILSVTIGGSVLGRDHQGGGSITAVDIKTVRIGGSMIGGTASFTGQVSVVGVLGKVTIGGNLTGGTASGLADLLFSGSIAAARLGSLTIGGSIIAGTDLTIGNFESNGAVRIANDIGSLVVKGSLLGNSTYPVVISTRGQPLQTTTDLAIKTLTVGGSVELSRILAGFGQTGLGIDGAGGINADAQIGTVRVGRDWIASSILASIDDNDLDGDAFADETGDGDDANFGGPNIAIVSRIGSIIIKGQARGTPGGADHFGFVAQQIGSLNIGGTRIPLVTGPANDTAGFALGGTGDFRVREVGL